MVAFGLLGTPLGAAGGDVNINIGGINSGGTNGTGGTSGTSQGGGLASDLSRRIDKPQTGIGGFSLPDSVTRHSDNPTGGVPGAQTQKSLADPTTFSHGSSGTFSPTLPGQSGGQLCSNTDVTVGPTTQSQRQCPNTTSGTIRN